MHAAVEPDTSHGGNVSIRKNEYYGLLLIENAVLCRIEMCAFVESLEILMRGWDE